MTDLDRLLFLHYCKIQAEKQDDIPFSSTKEYDDLKSEILRRCKIVDNLEYILKTECVDPNNSECIFCKAKPLLQSILKDGE